jgi:hypothetical protein
MGVTRGFSEGRRYKEEVKERERGKMMNDEG